MDDRELEARLRGRLHRRFDTGDASSALHRRISEALEPEPVPQRSFLTRFQPLLVAAAAVIVLVAAALVIGPRLARNEVAAPTPSPTVAPVASPSAATSSASPALQSSVPSPSPANFPSVPPSAWSGLAFQKLSAGPTSVMTLTAWSGGYLAIGYAGSPDAVEGRTSVDGLTWAPLASGALPPASLVKAVAFGDGIEVVAEDSQGVVREVTSADGVTWSSPAVVDLAVGPTSIASGAVGLVATTAKSGDGLRFKPAGVASVAAWQHTSLPNGATVTIESVAATADGFVAVGIDGHHSGQGDGRPVAFTSPDGLTWTAGTVPSDPNDGFVQLYAAANGLVAISETPDVTPGMSTFWSSANGSSWQKDHANPFGVIAAGEGVGSVNGSFTSDGTRILAFGLDDAGTWQVYDSLDGTSWTPLGLTAPSEALVALRSGDVAPWLLRDGILVLSTDTTWFAGVIRATP